MLHPYPPVPFNVSQSITPAIQGTRRIGPFQESVFQKHHLSDLSSGKIKKRIRAVFQIRNNFFYLRRFIEKGRTEGSEL